MNRRRSRILLVALLGTFVLVRLWLHARPNADFFVGPYNIHHLFTGLLLVAVFIPPLLVRQVPGRLGDFLVAGTGVGLSLALDEWVYLITTDGSNTSYLLPISFWGGAILVGTVAAFIWWLGCKEDAPSQPAEPHKHHAA
jgi:hypothetical protein